MVTAAACCAGGTINSSRPMMPRYANLGERLIANSYIGDVPTYADQPCWIWMGEVSRNRSGMLYGRLSMRYKSGPRKGKVRKVAAHRASVQVFHQGKRITPKTVVMHLCNNTLCINPAHLKGGTQARNVQQCVKDGRHKTPFRKDATV